MSLCVAPTSALILASTAAGQTLDYFALAKWGGLVVLGIVLLVVLAAVYRRRFRAEFQAPLRQSWTLEDLRILRAQGTLSDAEYARLRDRVLAEMGMNNPRRDPDTEDAGL
jgi:hypothetical protein